MAKAATLEYKVERRRADESEDDIEDHLYYMQEQGWKLAHVCSTAGFDKDWHDTLWRFRIVYIFTRRG